MSLHLRFWRQELPLRARSWIRQRWWPTRIRQLETERAFWKAKLDENESTIVDLWDGQLRGVVHDLAWLCAGLDPHDPIHADIRALLDRIRRSDAHENWRRALQGKALRSPLAPIARTERLPVPGSHDAAATPAGATGNTTRKAPPASHAPAADSSRSPCSEPGTSRARTPQHQDRTVTSDEVLSPPSRSAHPSGTHSGPSPTTCNRPTAVESEPT